LSENPYAPPRSEVEVARVEPPVPEAILKKIRNAWIAGLISTSVTLLLTLLAVTGTTITGFSAWQFLDVALVLGLTVGIYRKSRLCAMGMLAYFVISKIIGISETGRASGIAMALIFLYFYAQGVHGTFVYHRLAKDATAPRPPPA